MRVPLVLPLYFFSSLQNAWRPIVALVAVVVLLQTPLCAQTRDPNDPAVELASFKVAEGFEVQLFASEKDGIVKPIQMRWDTRGRLWVIGSQIYPQIKPGEEPNDKVWIVEDSNRDGKADQVTVFADGLMIPTGIEIADKASIYLGEGTKLWRMTDTDGDGKADKKEVVFRGFGTGDNHQNINSFRWSPGGELMFCQGLHAFARIETPHGIVGLDEAGLWRMRPREMRLDAFYGGQADPQNPWGWVWTKWGQPLVAAGNNATFYYPLPEMIRGVQGGRRENIWKDGRGRKTSGPDIVGTAHFPEEWQGSLITGGYINHSVLAMRIEEDGAGFRLVDREPLLTSTHASFRPVDVKFGPDGALYVCDWYNPIIGHYQTSFRHPDRDKAHGRIWRITAKGRSPVIPPPIGDASIRQLLENLRSGERYVRYATRIELASRPTGEVVKLLGEWWPRIAQEATASVPRSDYRPGELLLEALNVFEWHEAPEPKLLRELLRAEEPGIRAYAAGTLARWHDRLPADFNAIEALADLAHAPEARVRLAAIVAAGNIARAESVVVALGAADQPGDSFIDLALRSAVKALRPQWEPLVAQEQPQWKPHWRGRLAELSGIAPPKPRTQPVASLPGTGAKSAATGKWRATPEFVAALTVEVRERGDARRGAEIYKRPALACATCHAIGGEGNASLGPPLDAIGAGQPIDFIIGAVLEPQREVKEGFEAYEIVTRDGATYSGYFVAGTEAERTVRDLGTGKEVRLRPEQIAKRTMRGSVMPAGLTDSLTREELRDLIRYLSELGKPR